MTTYTTVRIPAYQIVPYKHALYCRIEGTKEPFWNEYVCKRWSKEGDSVVFMLDTHNGDIRYPFEIVEVGLRDTPYPYPHLLKEKHEPEAFLKERPRRSSGDCDPLKEGVSI